MSTGAEDVLAPLRETPLREWRLLPVSEIFGPTIQGEGELIGIPTLFVRFGGCDYRCRWCDSLHAVLPEHKAEWEKLTPMQIVERLYNLQRAPYMVTLSGGNPALHDLTDLVALLHEAGYMTAVETQGTKWPAWLLTCSSLILSPKPPSSGETPDLDALEDRLAMLAADHPWYSVKVVVMDEGDLAFADDVRIRCWRTGQRPLILQVGNPYPPGTPFDGHDLDEIIGQPLALAGALMARYRWLAEEVLKRGWSNVRVLPQLHTLAWGNRRGV